MAPAARQYQTFPDAPGDSESLTKLRSLRLPELVGQSFLDLGCNEGLFCGYAHFAGASRVVGLDASEAFIGRARRRFPDIEFLHQNWDTLPDGPFDVILLASALHYAADQAQLIHRVMKLLAPKGVLVLELGIASGEASKWVEVDRGADRRQFATWAKVNEVLAPYAWKLIGKSVSQKGDPITRHVLHVNVRKPVAYLVMQPPGYGKTTICRELFKPAGVRIVACDESLLGIASGRIAVDPALRESVATGAPDRLDLALRAVLDSGQLSALVRVWLDEVQGATFALDVPMPESHQDQTELLVAAAGYLPIRLNWDRPGANLRAIGKVADMAHAYFAELATKGVATPMPFKGTLGAVVQLGMNAEVIDVFGWAVHEDGRMPLCIEIRLGDTVHAVTAYVRTARPQIQSRLGLSHPMYGFKIRLPRPSHVTPDNLVDMIQVYGGARTDQLSGPFSKAPLLPQKTAPSNT